MSNISTEISKGEKEESQIIGFSQKCTENQRGKDKFLRWQQNKKKIAF